MDKATLLQVEDLCLTVPYLGSVYPAVEHVSFSMAEGDSFGLIGESGCGKSLTALAIAGLLPEQILLSSGKIIFDGVDLTQLTAQQMQAYHGDDISMVFQDSATSLNPLLTVGYQLREVIELYCHTADTTAKQKQLAEDSLDEVGLADAAEILSKYPHQLSGGQRQRIMLAMAMLPKPRLLLADEPTTALDLTTQQQILDLIRSLQKKHHLTLLMISHNMQVVQSLCRRTLVMYAGKIVEQGPTESILQQPQHPYSKALLGAMPTFDRRGKPLATVEGMVPPLYARKLACTFSPRCSRKTAECDLAVAEKKQADRMVLCNHPEPAETESI